jgi:HEPN domain-containing protein
MSVERNLKLAEEFAFQANVELETAAEILEKRRYYAACFHAQQAAEGMVKAALLALDRRPERMHSLDALTQLFPGKDGTALARLRESALLLDKLYIPTRYVDALGGIAPAKAFTEREADDAIAAARRIMAAAAKILERERKPRRK